MPSWPCGAASTTLMTVLPIRPRVRCARTPSLPVVVLSSSRFPETLFLVLPIRISHTYSHHFTSLALQGFRCYSQLQQVVEDG